MSLGRSISNYFNATNFGSGSGPSSFVFPSGVSGGTPTQVFTSPILNSLTSVDNVLPSVEKTSFETESSIDSFMNAFSTFDGSLMGPGMGLSSLNSARVDYQSSNNLVQARIGNGPNGSAFDALNHAEQQSNFDRSVGNVESGLIAAGSMMGPEGLAAGLASAAVVGMGSSLFSPSQDTTMSTTGNLVNASST